MLVKIEAVEPTCKDFGSTEAEKCSVCDLFTKYPMSIPPKGCKFDDQYDAECNVCGAVRDAACRHSNVKVIPGKPATCLESGLTDGKLCLDCGQMAVEQEYIHNPGHNWVQKPAT